MKHPAHPDYHNPFLRHGVVFDPATMTILSVVSTVATAAGSIMSGNAARGAANYEARQMEQNAGQERAVSQRRAIEQRKQGLLANSTVQARAAASGAGATDKTVLDIEADNAGAGEYGSLMELHSGEEKARGLEMGSAAKRYEGQTARQAGLFKAGSTLMSGGASLYDRYGNDGPGGSLMDYNRTGAQAGTYWSGQGQLPWLYQ